MPFASKGFLVQNNYRATHLPTVNQILAFIFFHVEENEPKEDARAPLYPARRRHGRSTRKLARLRLGYGELKQSARFFPSVPSMLGAGQWENQKLTN